MMICKSFNLRLLLNPVSKSPDPLDSDAVISSISYATLKLCISVFFGSSIKAYNIYIYIVYIYISYIYIYIYIYIYQSHTCMHVWLFVRSYTVAKC